MELKAIYLSYSTRSSIHNRRLSCTEMHLLDGGLGGAGPSRDNEQDERARS